jgi:hypothetical protein
VVEEAGSQARATRQTQDAGLFEEKNIASTIEQYNAVWDI